MPISSTGAIPVAPLDRLSPGQIACLRGVLAHQTSKEIARDLGISPHTVDARIRSAISLLGVDTRRDAALILQESEGAAAYQPPVYQPLSLHDGAIAQEDGGIDFGAAANVLYPTLDETKGEQNENSVNDGMASAWPGAQEGKRSNPWKSQRNILSTRQRVLVILAIALISAVVMALIVSGLLALSTLLA